MNLPKANVYSAILRSIGAIASISLMLSVAPSYAQVITGNVDTATWKSLAGCSKSTLTEQTFLDMIHAIVMHGDLTDVAFIENTLRLKFSSETTQGGGINDWTPYKRNYVANALLGTQIEVRLSVSFNSNQYPDHKRPTIKQDDGLYFGNLHIVSLQGGCGHLSKETFSKKFDGGFIEGMGSQNEGGGCKILVVKSVPTKLSYGFGKDGSIKQVFILQASGLNSQSCRSAP